MNSEDIDDALTRIEQVGATLAERLEALIARVEALESRVALSTDAAVAPPGHEALQAAERLVGLAERILNELQQGRVVIRFE